MFKKKYYTYNIYIDNKKDTSIYDDAIFVKDEFSFLSSIPVFGLTSLIFRGMWLYFIISCLVLFTAIYLTQYIPNISTISIISLSLFWGMNINYIYEKYIEKIKGYRLHNTILANNKTEAKIKYFNNIYN